MKTDKTRRLGEENINILLFKLSLPAIIGMLVMALYSIADTIFIGLGAGSMAIAGVSVVFPIQMLITTFGQTIGVGGSSIISRSLGSGELEKSNLTLGNIIMLIIILSALGMGFSYLLIDEILIIFGAKGEIFAYAHEYFFILLPGLFFLNIAMALNNVIRAEGNSKYAMIPMLISALINLILDPIFIFSFGWGVKGAALASVFAQVIAFIFFIYYFGSGKSTLKIRFKYFKFNYSIVKEIIAIGSSSFIRHGASSIVAAVLNNSLIVYHSELAVAAFGIIYRILMVAFMPMFGLAQGFMPITGYNFGAKSYNRVKDAIKSSTIAAIGFGSLCTGLIFLFPTFIAQMFTDDPELVELTTKCIKVAIIMLPLVGFQVIGTAYFQAIGKAKPSIFLAVLRQILLFIPMVLILPRFFNFEGILYAFPLSDFLASVITFGMIIPEINKLLSEKA
ncbi:MAG: MATE family efflux transporter [Rhodothermaceae bacterium]